MARIFPFRGIRYSPGAVGDLASVMTEPYDKITPAMQDGYYARSEKSFVRLIKGRVMAGDNASENQYTRANRYFREWLKNGTFSRDEKPSIYIYQSEYAVPSDISGTGETKIRNGFIALGRLQDFSEGGVKPHEQTFAGPKADRLNLMRATGANFECIYMLYRDPKRGAGRVIEEVTKKNPPRIDVTTEDGVIHRLWPMSDPAGIEVIVDSLADKELFIADGHHRYETAVNYMHEMRAAGRRCEGTETYENCMMTFVNMADELTILPTHRLIGNVAGFEPMAVLDKLKEHFQVDEFAFANANGEKLERRKMMKALADGADGTAFGFCTHGSGKYFLLTLKKGIDPTELIAGPNSDAWKRLDVVILHKLILDRVLGVRADKRDEGGNVWFERVAATGMDQVREGKYQAMFVLNPTRIEDVQAVASSGEKMPQKSTDFYPKLLSGLVLNELNFVDDPAQ